MKSALILEKDATSCKKMSKLLKWLGYVSAPVHTPDQALAAAGVINFNVIVTYTTRKPNDRRSLTGELKRLAPKAAIVIIEENEGQKDTRTWRSQGASAVIRRPASVEALRKVVEFEIDGYRLQPFRDHTFIERRRKQ